MITIRNFALTLILLIMGAGTALASHILAGGLTYQFVDSTSGNYHYKIKLTLYADCLRGQPEAIAQDNPAFITIYRNDSSIPFIVDSAFLTSSVSIPVDYTTPCGTFTLLITDFCTLKRTFEKDLYLPQCASGYTVAYQRCCRSSAIYNVLSSGDEGTTYFCTIPPVGAYNTSAVFTKNPPLVVCKDNLLVYDLSATDADGDSLSYELSQCYATKDNDIKPVIAAQPPYDPLPFIAGFSYSSPMGSSVTLNYNPVSGAFSLNPDHLGLYVIGISCHEWRNGVLINTTVMEFNCLVINCVEKFDLFAGNDTVIIAGDSVHFHATGGASYMWDPSTYLNNPAIADPTGIFPAAGVVTYILRSVSDSGCVSTDTVTVNVIDHASFRMPNAFTPNGDNVNDQLKPISLKNASFKTLKVFDRSGKVIYNGNSANEGWDGRVNGKEAGLGTYTWELQYDDEKGVSRRQTGNVILIK